MKLIIVLFLSSFLYVNAQDCKVIFTDFEKEEKAYDTVAEIAIASNVAFEIIGGFLKASDILLKTCPKSISLDRQYTLKRKLLQARQYQQSYKVFNQEQLKQYAISHPENIVVYKWGTIKAVR